MTLAIKHRFISGKSDGADPTDVRPSNWNDDHDLSTAPGTIVGSDTSGPGTVQELPLAFDPDGNAAFTDATGYTLGAKGTTAERPAGVAAYRRWNTDTGVEEYYDGAAWQSVASKSYVDTAVAAFSGFTTGDGKISLKAVADAGWVMCTDGTIGSATSGATYANADAQALFLLLWANVSDAYAPVNTGRGVSAAADWAANKKMGLLTVLGRAIAVAGTGAGLTARTLGSNLGEEGHVLTGPEIPLTNGSSTPSVSGGSVIGIATQVAAAHNIMQPTVFWNVMIKL